MKHLAKTLIAALVVFAGNFAMASSPSADGSHDHNKLCPIFFKTSNVCATVEFTKGPVDGDESQFLVKFFDHKSAHGEHVMVDPADLKIDLWMYMGNHGGHGSAPVKFVKQDTGTYFVSEVYFVMAGRWNVRFFANGEQSDLIVDVKP